MHGRITWYHPTPCSCRRCIGAESILGISATHHIRICMDTAVSGVADSSRRVVPGLTTSAHQEAVRRELRRLTADEAESKWVCCKHFPRP
jgi:hypothetical protein